jgi:membrane-associated phospholipid phosphatase
MRQNNFFTKMTHLVESLWFFAGVLVLAAISYMYFDRPISLYFHEQITGSLFKFFNMSSKLGFGLTYFVFFLLLALFAQYILKKRPLAQKSFFIFMCVFSAGVVCDVLKILLGRARPAEFLNNHVYGFFFLQTHNNMWSFPSGHATVIAALAFALSYLIPKYWWAFFSLMFYIALTRLLINAHFLSDVIIGLYLGAFVVTKMVKIISVLPYTQPCKVAV